jgi:YceI-like domain
MNRNISLIAGLVLIFSFIFFDIIVPQSKSDIEYITLPRSRIWIDGSSTVNEFSCSTSEVNGVGYLGGNKAADSMDVKNDSATVNITVNVKTFDCGIDAMNDDMYNAMKYKVHPEIKYKLLSAMIINNPDSASTNKIMLNTYGELTIAGVTNKVNILISVYSLKDDIYHLVGAKQLSMHDFDITPPSHFFGIIKAHDQLVVHFDLYAKEKYNVGIISGK